jgi:chemotaxis protein CheD
MVAQSAPAAKDPWAEPGAAGRLHTLHPGDVALAERGDRLETLLGSCVAIVLTDPRRTRAAMCHVVHATQAGSTNAAGDTAFGENALASMCSRLRKVGIVPTLCEAFVVGGGNMFPDRADHPAIGERNVAWALDALKREGIPVVWRDLGGPVYRRLSWTVGSQLPDVFGVPV